MTALLASNAEAWSDILVLSSSTTPSRCLQSGQRVGEVTAERILFDISAFAASSAAFLCLFSIVLFFSGGNRMFSVAALSFSVAILFLFFGRLSSVSFEFGFVQFGSSSAKEACSSSSAFESVITSKQLEALDLFWFYGSWYMLV